MSKPASRAEYWQAYYAKNRDKIREKNRKWAKENPEKMRRYRKAWEERFEKRYGMKPQDAYKAYLEYGENIE